MAKKSKTNGNGKPKGALTDAQIIERANKWAKLHEDPATRPQMDKVIAPLSVNDARRVILCGQRIRGGLKPKIAT